MSVSREEILHIANLARLNLSEEEIQRYTNDMKDILNFANTINKVNTENIEESIAAGHNVNVFRKDEVKEFEDKDLLMENARDVEDGMFHLPSVL